MPDADGNIKGISVPDVPWCTYCSGTGLQPPHGDEPCKACGGTGASK